MSESDVVKASYWFPATDFPATDIDSSLFTHLFCTFADLEAESYEITIATWNQAPFHAFTETVQQRNPHVKTLLSIGGGNADKDAFASMASNPDSRASFIQSTITVARSYGFHGLDLDWEYPRNEEEMYDFGKLLEEWRSAVEAESNSSGTTALILTAAVYYSSNYQGVPYPVLAISNSLDWINLMAYDFYGPGWSTVTGPPASLYLPTDGRSGDSGVRDWTEAGLPAKKAVLGFPYYGWAWTLADPDVNGYDANTTGPAISDDGEISYRQLQTWIVDNGATKVHDDMMVGDYCYAGTTWIGYDSEKSIVTKVIYAKQKGLLGYFSWHVGGDDNSELSSADTTGPAISSDGEISFRQLKTWIVENGATTVHDEMMVGDYCYAGTTWIGYGSEKSILTKVRYAKQKGLLGLLFIARWRPGPP
ncbi:hypothetical protein AXX17_AT4G23240 [Arabidopsis thaliana]|uniref:GH18 domain-containing protein n=1 Tax=Arabidopsis thaliana TaxID=3702 RepID=A0A178UUY4_ARATH|nr:hypothetical protein AXX17_AT4G23240 [Arabidopsis thaliana]